MQQSHYAPIDFILSAHVVQAIHGFLPTMQCVVLANRLNDLSMNDRWTDISDSDCLHMLTDSFEYMCILELLSYKYGLVI